MPPGEVANTTNFPEVRESLGFQVFQSTGAIYDTSRTDILYLAKFEAICAPKNSLGET